MEKQEVIKATAQLISSIDTELELLEEHGGQAERYKQLARALMAAQKRLYRLRHRGVIRMAEVPISLFSAQIRYGPEDVLRAELHEGVKKWGRGHTA